MRNLYPIIIILLFALSSATAQQKKTEKAIIKTTIFCDHCKECETCGGSFKSEMLRIKGVKMYELDEKNMTITVYYDTRKTDLQTIRNRIALLGYDADDTKADVAAYDKLDNCCKKA